jgi:sporulation protein YqfC
VPLNRKTPLSHKIARLLDLPLDTMIDWPRIILSGNNNVVIQNHRGIIEYDQSVARIGTKLGELLISGRGLVLMRALKEEIIVEGKIDRIELIDWR